MKNIACIFESSTEENFKEEGRPDKWQALAKITKEKLRNNSSTRRVARRNKKVKIPARPYLQLTDEDFDEILDAVEDFLK